MKEEEEIRQQWRTEEVRNERRRDENERSDELWPLLSVLLLFVPGPVKVRHYLMLLKLS